MSYKLFQFILNFNNLKNTHEQTNLNNNNNNNNHNNNNIKIIELHLYIPENLMYEYAYVILQKYWSHL